MVSGGRRWAATRGEGKAVRYGPGTEEYLNELAQELRPLGEGITWFASLPEDAQTGTLRLLAGYCHQAHPTAEEALESIRRSGLRPTRTPAVMLVRGRIEDQVGRIAGLAPQHERMKAFRLLIALLAVADGRRRAGCRAHDCGHHWHHLTAGRESPLPRRSAGGREEGGGGDGRPGGTDLEAQSGRDAHSGG